MTSLRPLAALLFSTALLLTGHGLHLTLLPLRAASLGYSETTIGLTASAYYVGFIMGCFINPRIIARVGHIRSFSALLAIFLSCFLLLDSSSSLWLWFVLRFALGIMMCGAYTVIESWLTDQTPRKARGQVLAIYTFLVLAAMSVGQFLINLAPLTSSKPFIIGAILIALAIVPVSLTRSLAPAPVRSTRSSFRLLYRRSHTAFAGGLVSGIVLGSFWSLGALFALRATGSKDFVPLFITASILGGALAQYPIGLLSDRVDRRFVLASLCAATALSGAALAIAQGEIWLLTAGFFFGASANAIYAVSLAKAADNSKSHEFVTIGSSLLLLNSLGAAIGPVIFGQLMLVLGDWALFMGASAASALAAVYIARQPKSVTAVSVEEQSPFVPAGSETVPGSFDSDPRKSVLDVGSISVAAEPPSIADSIDLITPAQESEQSNFTTTLAPDAWGEDEK